ncbi:hypothetical protein JHC09_13395 [Devosia sp. MC532]|uniref:hypothetical protein n=1 Tax=Devosia sp. MC532 TaxID=2799788 RepID=UPI0018F37C70|nr:hypothetical protein [Devosia sp. MC532]MBJ7578878.1 hypothetical protein [Devosia sp. MC532]
MKSIVLACAVVLCAAVTPAMAQSQVDFGDDSGSYANDGECDDPRFTGAGMTATDLLSEDLLADATDCQSAFDAGKISLLGVAEDGKIDFGDDEGEFANDGECDDMRFSGSGMTETALIQDDIMHDATDCRAAAKAGTIELRNS